MIKELAPLGVAIPGGFAVSSTAYDALLGRYELRERLQLVMDGVDGKEKPKVPGTSLEHNPTVPALTARQISAYSN
jgi:phosphoenolpyruvate synthase/pyruvate phosphate dikinase